MTALLELTCGDDAAAWMRLGFAVEGGDIVRVGPVSVRLDGAGGGLRGWVLEGDDGPQSVGGITTRWSTGLQDVGGTPPEHPNRASALDHVVLLTGDRDATAAALTGVGGEERRRAGPPTVPVAMAFVRLGGVVVEVAEGGPPPRLWGLVAVVDDLEELRRDLEPGLIGAVKDAVQPGRHIATVQATAGLETALAFMTPRVRD